MIGLLIITHEALGEAYEALVRHFFPQEENWPPMHQIKVQPDDDHQRIVAQAKAALSRLDQGAGVLVLTDIMGATPSNAARVLMNECHGVLITGLNAPMLIKAVSHASRGVGDLADLVSVVKAAGVEGIMAFDWGNHLIGESICKNNT